MTINDWWTLNWIPIMFPLCLFTMYFVLGFPEDQITPSVVTRSLSDHISPSCLVLCSWSYHYFQKHRLYRKLDPEFFTHVEPIRHYPHLISREVRLPITFFRFLTCPFDYSLSKTDLSPHVFSCYILF